MGFLFVGNRLCLDFVNTEVIRDGSVVDLWSDFGALSAWLRQAGILDRSLHQKKWGPSEQSEALTSARKYRRVLRGALDRICEGRAVPQNVVRETNSFLQRRPGYRQMVRSRKGFSQRFYLDPRAPEDLLVPVAESAADLFCQADLSQVQKCENPGCILYFYDTSKNQSRRWCSMQGCGNRMKAAAYYSRRRASKKTVTRKPGR